MKTGDKRILDFNFLKTLRYSQNEFPCCKSHFRNHEYLIMRQKNLSHKLTNIYLVIPMCEIFHFSFHTNRSLQRRL